ncbi:MAG: hypothetical protein LBI19_03615 [Oscillospiraceae bacterium]|nr:hypothetical protein [Oscillospiraceae bacterium]
MSRRQITLLSVGAAVLLAAVLMGSVWLTYFAGNSVPFTLPSPLPSGVLPGVSAPEPALGGFSYTPLTVDARSIQAVLATVERPAAYRQTVTCTFYWPGGEETVTHSIARRGDLTRVETRGMEPLAQNRISTPDTVYAWTGDAMPVYAVTPEDADAEVLSGVPAWETVAALPPESILLAEYLNLPGERRCLRVLTEEAVYFGEYIVSLETGLLVKAAFTGAEGLAYEVKTGPPVLGDPGNEYFTLPDGRAVPAPPEAGADTQSGPPDG